MRLKQYLNKKLFLDLGNEFDLIENDCQPFLKDMEKMGNLIQLLNYWPCSGRNNNSIFFKGKVRKNRKPKDTPIEIHEFLDNYFYKKFGVKARSNSIFCTGDVSVADDYSDSTYYIFPIGNYKIIWSKIVADLYITILEQPKHTKYKIYDLESLIDGTLDNEKFKKIQSIHNLKIPSWEEFIKDQWQKLYYFLDSYKLDNKFTKRSLTSRNEIMLICDEYYAIDTKKSKHILKWMKKR